MAVPAFDLSRAYKRIAPELDRRWREICDATSFVLGPAVKSFEKEWAAYLGAGGAIGVANGTDALVVALRALGLRAGDEVIVPAFTFYATAEAVVLAGGVPVFADIEPATLNLDLGDTATRVTSRTVGIIGVHLYGRPFDVDAALALASRHGLWLMEDAAQAQGAAWKGRRVGTFGALTAWSFYPSKNLGCFGDGGALSGNDSDLLERARRIANHGQVARYQHVEIGTNSRLDSLQAAVLSCRLALLEGDNERRRTLARRYAQALAGVGDLSLPQDPAETVCVYHQLTVRTRQRAELMRHLTARSIGHAIHYPDPLHRHTAFAPAGGVPPSLPVAEAAAAEVLSLPMFPELTDAECEEACAAVREFYGKAGTRPSS
jgi:dTDP-4-amino-4,6-dideoxygalactose transaminase